MLRAPVRVEAAPEQEPSALLTMQVWHLALVSMVFVLVFWHFVLHLY